MPRGDSKSDLIPNLFGGSERSFEAEVAGCRIVGETTDQLLTVLRVRLRGFFFFGILRREGADLILPLRVTHFRSV